MDEAARVEVTSVAALAAWLAANHGRPDGVWLVTWKKRPGAPHVSYDEVVDELLCWGWIDSRPRKLDDDRTMLWIAPRRPGSGWSAVNKARLERLEARMQPPGRAKIAAAKADGSWAALDGASTLELPDDLAAALAALPGARAYWDRFPPSSRRGILEWITAAVRPATRAARVAETAAKAAENRKANFPAGRDAGPS
jgi:uncharacterized protein YdeI (YjbR/CyaY-like superfamily)